MFKMKGEWLNSPHHEVPIFNMYMNNKQSLNNIRLILFEVQITQSEYSLTTTDGVEWLLYLISPLGMQIKAKKK